MRTLAFAAVLTGLAVTANAQINWSNPTVETFKTRAEIQADLTNGSFTIDDTLGVAVDAAGAVYVVVDDGSFEDIIVKYDAAGTYVGESAGLDAFDSAGDSDVRFTGSIRFANNGDLLLADFQGATGTQFISMDPSSFAFTIESDDAATQGVSGWGNLDGTNILSAFTFGDDTIRVVDYAAGTAGADVSGGAALDCRAIDTVDEGAGVYTGYAAADDGSVFLRIDDVTGTPSTTDITPAPYTGATPESGTIRNLIIAPDGAMIWTDRGDASALRILEGSVLHEHAYSALTNSDFSEFDPRDYRGVALYSPDSDTVELLIANTPNGAEGVVKVTFTSTPTSVQSWELFQ